MRVISPEGQQPAQKLLQGAAQAHFAYERQHSSQEHQRQAANHEGFYMHMGSPWGGGM